MNLHDNNLNRNIDLARRHFDDRWERDFDRAKRGIKWGFIGVITANLIVWAVIIWAIVQLVNWITSK